MKTIALADLLTPQQIKEVEKILEVHGSNFGSNNALRDYLCGLRDGLEEKGVVPEYLAYYLLAKHQKLIP